MESDSESQADSDYQGVPTDHETEGSDTDFIPVAGKKEECRRRKTNQACLNSLYASQYDEWGNAVNNVAKEKAKAKLRTRSAGIAARRAISLQSRKRKPGRQQGISKR